MKFVFLYFFIYIFIIYSNLYSQENPLIAELTGLSDHQLISADLDIYGTASGDAYQLYIGNDINTTEWNQFASGTNVEDGYLGTLEINGYESGRYALRLAAEFGGFYVDTSLYIVIDRGISNIKPGFPIQMPTEDIFTFYPKFILVDDLDYDGNKEIIATNSNDGKLHIYNHDGSRYISPIQLPQEGSWLFARPCVADLNRDGSKEIVVLSNYYGTANISVYNSNGLMMIGWPKVIYNYNGSSSFSFLTVADINGDDELEIIASANQEQIGKIAVYNKDGYQLIGWPFTLGNKFLFKGPPAIVDLENDGKNELVIAAYSGVGASDPTDYMIAINYKGEEISEFRHSLESSARQAPAGDIDNDGFVEFMGVNGPIDTNGDMMEWNYYNTVLYFPRLVNSLPGNDLEIFFGYGDKYCLTDYKGNMLPGWPIRKDEYGSWGMDNIIADVDGDGSQDFIVDWDANNGIDPKYKPGLHIYNMNGDYLDGFPKYDWAYKFSNFLYEDLDGDGQGELLCMIKDSNQIYSLDLGYPYNPDNNDWPTVHHDNQNMNNYHAQSQNVIVFSQDDMQVDEDDSLTFRFAPAYLDWQTTLVSVNADTSAIGIDVSYEMLTLTPDPNWNGESEITITVNDGQDEQTSSFKLTVNPMPDSPKTFSLDSPKNNIILNISNNNINDSIVFKWNKAFDPDGDILRYSIVFSDSLSFLNKVGIVDSFYAIPYKTLSDLMTDNDILDLSTEWTVTTYDNDFSVPTSSGTSNVNFEKITTTDWDFSVTDYELPEDDTLIVTINSNLIDWEHCLLSVSSDTSAVETSILDSSIVIIPETDWNGKVYVTFDIYSGVIKTQEQFEIIVRPVQDVPKSFSLNTPPDSSIIIIDPLTVNTMLEFSWDNSTDPDNDILFYALKIEGLPSKFSKDSLSTTDWSISLNDVSNYLTEINKTTQKITWSVYAYDQTDTTKSTGYTLNVEKETVDNLDFIFADKEINEDDSLLLTINSDVVNWQLYNSNASSDTSAVNVTTHDSVIVITPQHDWYGQAAISYYIYSGMTEANRSFTLNVLPINDPPKTFDLLTPSDSAVIIIDTINVNTMLEFSWANSIDSDNDLLYYTFNVNGLPSEFSKDSLTSRSYSLSLKDVSNYLTAINKTSHEVTWSVFAFDQFDTTNSADFTLTLRKETVDNLDYVFTDKSINEDNSLELIISSNVINWQIYNSIVSSDTSAVSVITHDSVLVVTPLPDWNGQATISFYIYSGMTEAKRSFVVNVLPVNDSPHDLNLLSPSDSTVIIIDTLSVNTMLEFSWENAIDPDDDILHYAFSIVGLPSEFNKDSLSSPACSLSLNDVASYLSDINNTSREVSWSVIAFDQFDTTKSVDYALSFRKETVDNLDYVFTDTNIDEDDSLVITITSDIINWEQFYSVASSDTADVDVKTNDSVIVITPEPDWNGQAVISYYIYSGMTESKRSFLLNVVPVNDPPQAFNLLTPSDSAEVIIDNSTIEDSLMFSWEYAIDIDSENLLYSVMFTDSLAFMNKDSIQSNRYKFPIRALSDYLTEKGIENTVLEWSVYCSDIHETVEAANNPLALKILRTIATNVEENLLPDEIFLSQNYPNPFNPASRIEFGLTMESDVSLNVYNMLGQLVAVIINSKLDAGYHYAVFDGSNLASGIYIYRLEADNKIFTKKMILIK